jgi:midasin
MPCTVALQLGVVAFGGSEGVVPLLSLEQPFTDAVGPRLLGGLTFTEDNTIGNTPMADLLTSLNHILATARHRITSGV